MDNDDLENCTICGDDGVWPDLDGICEGCREAEMYVVTTTGGAT